MKKMLAVVCSICILLLSTGCDGFYFITDNQDISIAPITQEEYSYPPESPGPDFDVETGKDPDAVTATTEEIRALWISYLDLTPILKNQSEEDFTKAIDNYFEKAKQFGFNDMIVQVRPFGDALYPSKYYPYSRILTGTQGKDPGYDPLKIMVETAKEKNLRIEAWLNPYRVQSSSTDLSALSDDNVAKKWAQEKEGYVVEVSGSLYLNPAKEEVQEQIINGVQEIVENYEVDGIHFDDYFYPTTDPTFDKADYSAYQEAGGELSLADWRRENVNNLVSGVYKAIKEVDESVLFGISPQGNLDNDYDSQYIDVKKWVTTPGYLDYICPQLYYGFENGTLPYEDILQTWNDMITLENIQLYVGLSAYKLGKEDTWAGDGKKEWMESTDLLMRQTQRAREMSRYGGIVVFRYDSLFGADAENDQVKKEKENLKGIFSSS